MKKIRIDLARLKTQEEAVKKFGKFKGISKEDISLEELHELLKAWDEPLKIEIVIAGNVSPFAQLMEMLEDARTQNGNLLFVVIMYMA